LNPLGGGAVRCCAVALLLAATSLVIPPAASDRGGPDAYGYVWVDSRAPSPVVPFSWVEITTTGTRVALAADDCTFELSMGFQFRFYGVLVDQVHVLAHEPLGLARERDIAVLGLGEGQQQLYRVLAQLAHVGDLELAIGHPEGAGGSHAPRRRTPDARVALLDHERGIAPHGAGVVREATVGRGGGPAVGAR